ncbi:MAG: energy-coupling factor transporter transmembrane protein EcfT [Theionarchaea archaeon]|nr:energy-coupling factor transporter transmembrane protein EcfT [Theionarchaea archaeon]MBU7000054.1 energy-coupling factor transporter transmembrane protein EcfT [Theionarchaea archaeon]MBU7021648.1 energy-coupling factor transporter transmembrane protein EcfT [Theionarchaea archaeon]MBU7034704.1 energy-coupling factor transporter transmembrane protein EcfT [Theionarchaea archaeon]MBU7039365.1 energy-coupling factor transporter transmembrane protein EcfT [Theionarchaea archaeon]
MIQQTMFIRKRSFLHSLDPRTKLFVSISLFLVGIMFSDYRVLTVLFVLEIIVLRLVARIPFAKLFPYLKLILPLVVMALVIWPLFQRTGTVLVSYWKIIITEEGIRMGIAMSFRLLSLIVATYLLLMTTEQRDLVLALVTSGLRYDFGLMLAIALSKVPALAGIAMTIMDAQKARGLELEKGNIVEKVRKYIPILIPLIISAIRLAEALSIAIDSRAFGRGNRTYLRELHFTVKDALVTGMTVVILSACVGIRAAGFGVMELP